MRTAISAPSSHAGTADTDIDTVYQGVYTFYLVYMKVLTEGPSTGQRGRGGPSGIGYA